MAAGGLRGAFIGKAWMTLLALVALLRKHDAALP